ncbi:MAG: helix-turn-helix transcriptional regulator, partial [Cyclobacteriaceae bacterium]|nr:helix-turn-helix transcriptional regulator [Cyclobacteriaceae bacterium]
MPEVNHIDQFNGSLSSNERFILKFNRIIDDNLGNERFGVSELADSMDLSRMQVYRRVQKLTGKNVSQYIREKRLQYARDLLIREAGTVSEIAYRSGFGSP